jgi:protein-L-isoaspartate(D-aspartate) O-methyltransferase
MTTPAALNLQLITELRQKHIVQSDAVECAFLATPRHLFVPHVSVEEAYRDEAIVTKAQDGAPISSCSQPAIIAIMLEQLDVRAGMNVLEIGAGTGYNAALLGQLVGDMGHVTTIDIDEDIAAQARKNLQEAQASNVEVICADGGYGHVARAPYDRLILTVGASDLTPAWFAQLKAGGRIVLPLGLSARQYSIAFDKRSDVLRSHSLKLCGFMRLRGTFASADTLKVTDDYMLGGQQLAQLDTDKLFQLVRQPSQKHGLPFGDTEKLGDLLDYIALREPMLMFIPKDKTYFNFAYVLCTPALDSVALLVNQDMRQWDHIAHVWTYGTDDTYRTLLQHIASFQANGQPSLLHSTILAYPSGHAPTPTPTQWLVRRQWMEYLITPTLPTSL